MWVDMTFKACRLVTGHAASLNVMSCQANIAHVLDSVRWKVVHSCGPTQCSSTVPTTKTRPPHGRVMLFHASPSVPAHMTLDRQC